jgi:glycosyltransferase involved in cell wall biosynthesis
MRIAWRHYQMPKEAAVNRGYLNSATCILEALRERGDVTIEDAYTPAGTPQSRAVIHFCPPHHFRPYRGRKNILFSMWEADSFPPELLPYFVQADAHVVPSEYCRAVWEKHGMNATVARLGLVDAFRTLEWERSRLMVHGRRLRYLWLGAPSRRKGWELLAPAWAMAFNTSNAPVELYVKSIGDPGQQDLRYFTGRREIPEHETADFRQLVVVDRRDLERDALLELYRSAHVFIFPTFGEGFGLPALEAMAMGCLVVAPMVGGMTEFVSPSTAIVLKRSDSALIRYGTVFTTQVPSVEDLARKLSAVVDLWGTPEAERVRTNGVALARTFTWAHTAAVLRSVAENVAYNGLQAIAPAQPLILEAGA